MSTQQEQFRDHRTIVTFGRTSKLEMFDHCLTHDPGFAGCYYYNIFLVFMYTIGKYTFGRYIVIKTFCPLLK